MGSLRQEDVDVLIVGAGFSGIYQLYLARNAGFKAKVVERGGDVGGTWYWNRYPGAMSDTEAFVYRYSFDKDLWLTADLPDHYAKQPDSFAYLKQVVEKHHLRKDMEFEVEVINTSWSEQDQKWYTTTTKGAFVSKYLVTGLGLLTTPYWPDIPGLKSFKREIYHTSRFPWDWDFSGKRVGVIGNGSTGIQVITQLGAEKKVKSLVSFQRNPQYTVPSGDRPMTKEERAELCSDYEGTWQKVKNSKYGFGEIAALPSKVAKPHGCLTGFEESTTSATTVSPEKRQRMFEESWSKGNGFRFLDTFSDITTNLDANTAAAEFIKGKIRQIVKNPDTARKLMPSELYFRRPLCDAGYYQVFNEDWVELVSLAETPIDTITATGIKTSDGVERELDVLIIATGFNGVDGSYNSIHFEGRHGDTLKEHWSPRSRSYLGLMVPNFPNLFMIAGPLGPFCNQPPASETQAEYITQILRKARDENLVVEASAEAENGWVKASDQSTEGSLFKRGKSWLFGHNIPGKHHSTVYFFGGLQKYREVVSEVLENDYSGFNFEPRVDTKI